MKMTGHFLLGKYEKITSNKNTPSGWQAISDSKSSLHDPFNRHIRLLITFTNKKQISRKRQPSDGKQLAFSDMRKFGNFFLVNTSDIGLKNVAELEKIGPEPLEKSFTISEFRKVLAKKINGKIKPTLMNQEIIAGIGNIYADEILWRAGIHPEEIVSKILNPKNEQEIRNKSKGKSTKKSDKKLALIFKAIKKTLAHGISLGGDSMSDYRNIHGEKGKFQETHKAYRRTGEKCMMPGCKGKIIRKIIAGRSAHFCDKHQKLYT